MFVCASLPAHLCVCRVLTLICYCDGGMLKEESTTDVRGFVKATFWFCRIIPHLLTCPTSLGCYAACGRKGGWVEPSSHKTKRLHSVSHSLLSCLSFNSCCLSASTNSVTPWMEGLLLESLNCCPWFDLADLPNSRWLSGTALVAGCQRLKLVGFNRWI